METGLNKTKTGFTLIELLVVIAIIGFLASVILIAITNARIKARNTSRVATVSQVSKALELYYNEHNSYPTGTYYSGWDSGGYAQSDGNCWCQNAQTQGGLETALVKGAFVNRLPHDPAEQPGDGDYLADGSGQGFLYISDGQSYILGTSLEKTNLTVPPQDATSTCMAAGNYQISIGSLSSSNCPQLTIPITGGGGGGGGGLGSGPPAISSISPTSGNASVTITITGSGFTSTGNRVSASNWGSVSNLNSADGSTISVSGLFTCGCVWPMICECASPVGQHNITVTNANGTSNAVSYSETQ